MKLRDNIFLRLIKTFLLCISNMSNHKIEIDFNDLKYNLYDLLGLNPDSSIRRVKKRYRKLILEYHPENEFDHLENYILYTNPVINSLL